MEPVMEDKSIVRKKSKAFASRIVKLTLALALLSGCSKTDGNAAKTLADEPLPVRTLAATNAVFERATTVQGTLESVDSAVVSARIPGPLLRPAGMGVERGIALRPAEDGRGVLPEDGAFDAGRSGVQGQDCSFVVLVHIAYALNRTEARMVIQVLPSDSPQGRTVYSSTLAGMIKVSA